MTDMSNIDKIEPNLLLMLARPETRLILCKFVTGTKSDNFERMDHGSHKGYFRHCAGSNSRGDLYTYLSNDKTIKEGDFCVHSRRNGETPTGIIEVIEVITKPKPSDLQGTPFVRLIGKIDMKSYEEELAKDAEVLGAIEEYKYRQMQKSYEPIIKELFGNDELLKQAITPTKIVSGDGDDEEIPF